MRLAAAVWQSCHVMNAIVSVQLLRSQVLSVMDALVPPLEPTVPEKPPVLHEMLPLVEVMIADVPDFSDPVRLPV